MILGSDSAGVTSPGRKLNEDADEEEEEEEEEFDGVKIITRMRKFDIIFIRAHRSNINISTATNDLRGPLKIFIPRL